MYEICFRDIDNLWKIMQNSRCRYVAMVAETMSRIASKYSSPVLFSCRVEKK